MNERNGLPHKTDKEDLEQPDNDTREDSRAQLPDEAQGVRNPSALEGPADEGDLSREVPNRLIEDVAQVTTQSVEVSPVDRQNAEDELAKRVAAREQADANVLIESRRYTRRAFVLSAPAAAAGYGFYRWIDRSPGIEMQPQLLRASFQTNAAVARGLTQELPLAPTYSMKEAGDIRVNGIYGLKRALVSDSWRLQLVGSQGEARHPRFTSDVTAWEYRYVDAETHEDQGHDTKVDPRARTAEKMAPHEMLDEAKKQEERTGRMPRGTEEAGISHSTLKTQTSGLLLTMQDLLALPRHELITQFKCIEGWSQIVHWAGVRLVDLLEAYPPKSIDGSEPKYVYMETPDGDYYTGYDLKACRHPQALLATEMMGGPLTQFHGAPLRLHMPTKYGYKQIKRIGLISYTNSQPDDYWTKLGYDWYAGL